MLFDSIEFILFFPIVVMLYFAIPQKYKNAWLLIVNYCFYACWSIKYVILLLFTTMTTYLSARYMQGRNKKKIFFGGLLINLLILFGFKYFNTGFSLLNKIAGVFNISLGFETISIVLPIGMSFYMFQSLGYLIDVYKEKTEPENNFIKYALFVSFFATILSGPIERSNGLLKQIQKETIFSYENAKKGLLLMAYGYFQKILISNRVAILVGNAYTNHLEYNGAALALVMVLYSIQIYVDFAGYSYIAMGTAKVLGFDIINNFKQPYFAISIKDFWNRWHISLSQWLRDYVYIPMGGSRRGMIKTYRNLVVTFLVSGMWHGNGLKYIAWGLLHGIYQVVGKATEKTKIHIKEKLQINSVCWSYRFGQGVVTFVLVTFAWLFFRADSFTQALNILKRVLFEFKLGELLLNKGYLLGLEESRFFILLVEIAVVVLIDILHEKQISITDWLRKQNLVFRWMIYMVVVFVIVIGAIYNYGAEASVFIYSQF